MYFFWNTRGKKINKLLEETIVEKKYDIVVLAEYEDNLEELLENLEEKNINMFNVSTPGCERITFLSNRRCQTGYTNQYFTIKLFKLSQRDIKIIGAVHLPSKMHAEDSDRRALLEVLIRKIEELESKYKTNNTILVGDFNANPFEDCMINATGVHSVSSREIAKKIKRTVNRVSYNMFYNPMWNKFGDFNEPAGTYYYRKSNVSMIFWNIFDQVIIRPQLINKFKNEDLNIITEISEVSLINKTKIVVSDHLPIEFIIEED